MNRQLLGSHRERPARSADIDRLRMGRTLPARPRRYYTFLIIYVSVFFLRGILAFFAVLTPYDKGGSKSEWLP